MSNATGVLEAWDEVWAEIEALRSALRQVATRQVKSSTTKNRAKAVVQKYFRALRIPLSDLGVETNAFDELMQQLLQLANAQSNKSRYQEIMKKIVGLRSDLEIAIERKMSSPVPSPSKSGADIDANLCKTLNDLLPHSAVCYRQALIDLSDVNRLSYRGIASELREVMREVIDHLAPDRSVMAEPGFKLADGRTGPTMVQKVTFILRSRDAKKAAVETARVELNTIDEGISLLARSAYERGSASTHGETDRKEVMQIRRVIDLILHELLEVPN